MLMAEGVFLHVDTIRPYVQHGHYDLIRPNGKIILPQVWVKVIKPIRTSEYKYGLWATIRLAAREPEGLYKASTCLHRTTLASLRASRYRI
ncbi:hypothetical protein F4678DRAFT_421682 [Xylaria arbuscula]|nr:hypothetical protein F4678DRAFT_421682 [Xylaria arbuscula]